MESPPVQQASRSLITLLGLIFLLSSVLLIYSLAAVWPTPDNPAPTNPATAKPAQGVTESAPAPTARPASPQWDTNVIWFSEHFTISAELRLLLIVIISAALGSYIHAATSFSSYVGNGTLQGSWLWWYILRAPIGVALAIVFYAVVRGGFFSSGAVGSDMSPFGVAALSGLVGMFSKQATDKLRETFDNLFRTAPGKGDDARSNKLEPTDLVLKTIDPASVAAGATDSTIKIAGENFAQGATVLVNDLERQTDFVNASELIVHLHSSDTASAGTLKILVKAPPPSDRLSNPLIFTVRPTQV